MNYEAEVAPHIKKNIKPKVVFVMIFIFLLLGLAFYLGFFLTSNNKITEQPLSDLTPSEATLPLVEFKRSDGAPPTINTIKKEIDGIEYFFEKKELQQQEYNQKFSNSLSFMADDGTGTYELLDRFQNRKHGILSSITTETRDFWYVKENDEGKELFFIVEPYLLQFAHTNYEAIIKINTEDFPVNENILYINKLGFYSGTKILDYDLKRKVLLLETRMGDGCGGEGTVWLLDDNGKRTDVERYGSGCGISEEAPKYYGFDGALLYFASMKPDDTLPPPDKFSPDKYYSVHPYTLEKKIIPSIPESLVLEQ
ncbi:MAG: hypothetical protein COY80_01235 [Candidatus Pacebacteria bacterium CG_4_10_14_0_8_um_filter_42_14]|nr:MAG: hypothetical protein COY80_01235 [Candidatus Pacebacteria bacterium CG_4_10_14_0_8_um_filter_42_14]